MEKDLIDLANETFLIDILVPWLRISNRSVVIEDGQITEVILNEKNNN